MLEPHNSFVETESIRLHYLEWDFLSGNASLLSNTSSTTGQMTSTYTADATDEIPIVLLHGLGATAHFWRMVAERLCTHHRVAAFDIRGHGESDKPEADYELMTISEDIISAMAMLGMGQVILIAHGWGARVALALAARHPALVSHLVLVDCPHVEPRYWPGMTRERFIREQEHVTYASRDAFLALRRQEMSRFWSADIEHILLTTIEELPDGSIVELLGPAQQRLIRTALWEDRALAYYSKLSCPVLLVPAAPEPGKELPEQLVHTDDFALLKGHMAQQVATIIPRCSILWMPDTAHDIQLQRPTTLAQAILQFTQK